MKASADPEAEIKVTLKTLTDAYGMRDLKRVLECFASDPDVVLYGTGADERCIGPEQFRMQVERDWAQTESAAMSFTGCQCPRRGLCAWVAAGGALTFRIDEHDGSLPVRVTLALEKREGRWLIVQSHFSTSAAGQAEGEPFRLSLA